MVSAHVFLASLLLALAAQVLASPRLKARQDASSLPRSKLAPRGPRDLPTWAGIMWTTDKNADFHFVGGTFTVPNISGNTNDTVSIFVGFDGDTNKCSNSLQTGLELWIKSDGTMGVTPWYIWFNKLIIYYYLDFAVSPGDTIVAVAQAYNASSAVVQLENQSKHQVVEAYLSSKDLLCLTTAEMVVEDYSQWSGNKVPLANFGKLHFIDPYASRQDGTILGPSDGTLVDMKQKGKVIVSTSANNDTVTLEYN